MASSINNNSIIGSIVNGRFLKRIFGNDSRNNRTNQAISSNNIG